MVNGCDIAFLIRTFYNKIQDLYVVLLTQSFKRLKFHLGLRVSTSLIANGFNSYNKRVCLIFMPLNHNFLCNLCMYDCENY